MKAVVDTAVCDGYANCVIEADAIFDIDPGTGNAVVLVEVVPEDLVEAARRAESSCPVSAIRLEE